MFSEGSAWTALGFVLGLAAGGALAARLRGRPMLAGRRCPRCGASLSLWPAAPALSWVAARARCPRCGWETPRRFASFEAGVAAIGVAAILLLPVTVAIPVAAAGWLLLLFLIARR
jgi:prepilin signal peptidase PulO-like enzyme (type II secretory pathway)